MKAIVDAVSDMSIRKMLLESARRAKLPEERTRLEQFQPETVAAADSAASR